MYFSELQVITKDGQDRQHLIEGSNFVWIRNINLKSHSSTLQTTIVKWVDSWMKPTIPLQQEGNGIKEPASPAIPGAQKNLSRLVGKRCLAYQSQRQEKRNLFSTPHCGKNKLDQGPVSRFYNIPTCDFLLCWMPLQVTFNSVVSLVWNHVFFIETHLRLL